MKCDCSKQIYLGNKLFGELARCNEITTRLWIEMVHFYLNILPATSVILGKYFKFLNLKIKMFRLASLRSVKALKALKSYTFNIATIGEKFI